jgi:Zn finger protein HypA/HybF involved in hydrogenase expression
MQGTKQAATAVAPACPKCGSVEFEVKVEIRQVLVGGLVRIGGEDGFDQVEFRPATTAAVKWDYNPEFAITCACCKTSLSDYDIETGELDEDEPADPIACPSCGANDGRFLQWQSGSFAWRCRVTDDGSYETERSLEFGEDVGGIDEWECRSCEDTFSSRELGVCAC